MKLCNKCGELKDRALFAKDSRASDGLQLKCKACNKAYRELNKQRLQEYNTKYRACNRDKILKQRAVYRELNRDWINDRYRAVFKANTMRRLARYAQFRLSPDQKQEIVEFYRIATFLSEVTNHVWHVDHIVPLNGKTVCGLHVPWNLRAIPAQVNLSKGNKLLRNLTDLEV